MEGNFFQIILWDSASTGLSSNPATKWMAKRKLAHLTSVCLSWLHARSLPRELWESTFQTACHVVNRLPPWPWTKSSPFELIYHRKPNVSYFCIFGSICYVHVLKHNRTKLVPKVKKCIFVGNDTHRKGWRCLDLETKMVIVSRDVVFDEISSYKDDANGSKSTTTVALFPNDSKLGRKDFSIATDIQAEENT